MLERSPVAPTASQATARPTNRSSRSSVRYYDGVPSKVLTRVSPTTHDTQSQRKPAMQLRNLIAVQERMPTRTDVATTSVCGGLARRLEPTQLPYPTLPCCPA